MVCSETLLCCGRGVAVAITVVTQGLTKVWSRLQMIPVEDWVTLAHCTTAGFLEWQRKGGSGLGTGHRNSHSHARSCGSCGCMKSPLELP